MNLSLIVSGVVIVVLVLVGAIGFAIDRFGAGD